MYHGGNLKDWLAFTRRANSFQISEEILVRQFVEPMVLEAHISDLRNKLAHGQPIGKEIAGSLRDAILGMSGQNGFLLWVVRNIGP
jgi:hypothetical protein